MNIPTGLERDHILGVCASLAAPTTPLEDRPDRAADGLDTLTLAYPDRQRRDRVNRALDNCGYATETDVLRGPRPYAVRVTGWSTGRLQHRAGRLRRAAAQLGTDSRLQNTIARAIDAAAGQPAGTDPRTVAYDLAAEASGPMISSAIHKAGPLIPLTRIPTEPKATEPQPAEPSVAGLLRTDQRLADRVNALIGDHFNAACIAAATYIHTRNELTHGQTDHPAEQSDAGHSPEQADKAARDHAWAEARASIADPVDFAAFVQAAQWTHEHHPDNPAAIVFAFDYARDCHRTDPGQWPPLPDAYRAWNEQPPPAPHSASDLSPDSAPGVAAADFPNRPGAVTAAEPAPAQDAAGPARTHASRRQP